MKLVDLIAMVPEDKREEVKALVDQYDGAVKITSRDDAAKFARANEFVRSAIDYEVSKIVEKHDAEYARDKVPQLVEAEIARRNPPQDPRDAEVAKMRAEMEAMKRESIRKEQLARATSKLAEKGIPAKLAEYIVGEKDEETDNRLNTMLEHLEPWRNAAIEAKAKEITGGRGVPPMGGAPGSQLTAIKDRYNAAMQSGDRDAANRAYYELMAAQKLETQGR